MKYTLAALIFLLTSCSSFIKKIDEQGNNFVIIPLIEKTYCFDIKKPSLMLMNSNQTSQNDFLRIAQGRGYSSVELFAMWSLIQMAVRPDINSPEAQLEVFVNGPMSTRYFRFTLEQYKYPMLEGLSVILKTYSAKRTLRDLINRLEQDFPTPIVVDLEMESFIRQNLAAIKGNPTLKETFIRSDEPLTMDEKFKRSSFLKLIPMLSKHDDNLTSMPLLATENQQVPLTCNFSMQSYDESLYSVQEKANPNFLFGLHFESFSFLAATSLAYNTPEPMLGTFWLKSDPSMRHGRFDVAACLYEEPGTKKKMALLSTASRDPGQHLYHLFQYDMTKIKNARDMDSLMKFARHLFLTDPLRLIYESHRGSERQLTELLKLNIPIYNANNLGRISALLITPEEQTFILDNRYRANLTCQ